METLPKHESPHLSVVVPVYRSSGTLVELHERIRNTLGQEGLTYEIIFVEDSGGDDSWEMIQSICRMDPNTKGIQLNRNFGQHAATMCGMAKSRGTWVVTIDDDLEQSPESILSLLSRAEDGFDVVYGVYPTRSHKAWRNITSDIARKMFQIAIPSLNREYTSFRLVKGHLARSLLQFDSPFPFIDGYLSWLTNKAASVEVPHAARQRGSSNYSIPKLITHTLNIFVAFSDLPLKIATWIGLSCFGIGVVWLVTIVIGRLTGQINVGGFASIMAALTFFGGVQLLVLGIFGEYLGRMNFKSSRKPLFLIRSTLGDEDRNQ